MFIKLCNLGRDAETRTTTNGNKITTLACAYDVGYGDNKKTQWIEANWWGDRGEKMAQHLLKGTKILLTSDDLELEQFTRTDNTPGAKLKCKVVDIEFAEGKNQQQ